MGVFNMNSSADQGSLFAEPSTNSNVIQLCLVKEFKYKRCEHCRLWFQPVNWGARHASGQRACSDDCAEKLGVLAAVETGSE